MAVADMVTSNASPQPLNTTPPFLTLNYCIAIEGVYLSRD